MAPTIQSGHSSTERDKRPRPADAKRSDFVCRVKYCNTLPDIPFDPKFITYPFESTRFVRYNATSLERAYKHDLLTEHDLGVTIDLINPDAYVCPPDADLDVEDERLLEEDLVTQQNSKRSQHHAKSVSWLRRTEYISTEFTRYQPVSDKHETKVGYNVKKMFNQQDLYMDRESQIAAIDKTFDMAKASVETHFSKNKTGVYPVQVLPVFPDFDLWKYPCAQVIFDSDPGAGVLKTDATPAEEMSQAMIRGVMDESGEQFVAYFLPTQQTVDKRRRDRGEGVPYTDDDEYDYKMAREYNWNVKNKLTKGYEENYFFVFRDDGIYYNELETRVRLSKRRAKQGAAPNNSRLVVKHRPMSEQEYKQQEVRLQQLDVLQYEDEPEAEEETGGQSDGEFKSPKSEDDEKSKAGSDDEGDKASVKSEASGSGGSRRSSRRGSNASGSGSGSNAGSRQSSPAGSRASSRSRSRSKSRSRSRSGSRSRSNSRNSSPAGSARQSRSRSRSRSSSPASVASAARSRSGSPAGSGSGSAASSPAGSPQQRKRHSSAGSNSGSEAPSPKKSRAAEIFGSDDSD